MPNGPAFNPAAQGGRGTAQAAAAGKGKAAGRAADVVAKAPATAQAAPQVPGLMRATFRGGYTMSFWVGDPATGEAREFWHTSPDERVFTNVNSDPVGGRPRRCSRWQCPMTSGSGTSRSPVAGPITAAPVLLTTTNGHHRGRVVGRALEGRHARSSTRPTTATSTAGTSGPCPPRGGAPKQVSNGAGIETSPMPLAVGHSTSRRSRADARRPQSVGVIISLTLGEQKVIYPTLPASFPKALHVDPQAVTLKAADGFEFYNQLFVPTDIKPGEKRPAMVFVHGGPVRQMLLGYHYRHFYHMAYAVNQWLASQGYIVMSVNFRSGVGYGRSFRQAPQHGRQRQLRVSGRPGRRQVPARAAGRRHEARRHLGTLVRRRAHRAGARAQLRSVRRRHRPRRRPPLGQLARSRPPSRIQSSAIGAIDKWKSPVLLVHGDDDRNVAFQQTTGLVQLLRARDVALRAHRVSRRRARLAVALAMDLHLRADGQVPEEAPDG